MKTNLSMLKAYPIGSIYQSVSSISPAFLFGGTWEKIENKFLLSSGSSYAVNSTGGEAVHTLTVSEMPKHDGHISGNARGDTSATNGDPRTSIYFNGAKNGISNYGWILQHGNEAYPATYNSGGNSSHNNMPPYVAVNTWKRIS